ncbi:VirB4 family type IV secretion system protein, partial [Enterococcus faecalis]
MKKATETEQDDLADEIEILRTLSSAMGRQGEQIKKAAIRIFLSQPTLEELEKQVNVVLGTLNSDGYDG